MSRVRQIVGPHARLIVIDYRGEMVTFRYSTGRRYCCWISLDKLAFNTAYNLQLDRDSTPIEGPK